MKRARILAAALGLAAALATLSLTIAAIWTGGILSERLIGTAFVTLVVTILLAGYAAGGPLGPS